jgi:hypothetical protein
MTEVPTRVPDRFSLHSISRSSVAFSRTSLRQAPGMHSDQRPGPS